MAPEFDFEMVRESDRVHRYWLSLEGNKMTYRQVMEKWQTSSSFRVAFNKLLAQSEFVEFRWETPAVSGTLIERPFEFVLIESPGLARHPNLQSFRKQFGDAGEIVAFENLRGDACLVVPSPIGDPNSYVHLAAFIRHADENQ